MGILQMTLKFSLLYTVYSSVISVERLRAQFLCMQTVECLQMYAV